MKATAQRICSRLPAGASVYYLLQRSLGTLARLHDPLPMVREAARFTEIARSLGNDIAGARVLEIGTGRRLDMPLAFFLIGARSVVTVDLNPYLRQELVMGSARQFVERREEVFAALSGIVPMLQVEARLEALASCSTLAELMHVGRISYRAPADASALPDSPGDFDIQTSFTVMEHIPVGVLERILLESKRVLAPNGLAINHIDLSDHFAHEDRSISFVNFLKFSDDEWSKIAGNQFGYHNRLREDEIRSLFTRSIHQIQAWKTFTDQRSLAELSTMRVDVKFGDMSPEMLAVSAVTVASR